MGSGRHADSGLGGKLRWLEEVFIHGLGGGELVDRVHDLFELVNCDNGRGARKRDDGSGRSDLKCILGGRLDCGNALVLKQIVDLVEDVLLASRRNSMNDGRDTVPSWQVDGSFWWC